MVRNRSRERLRIRLKASVPGHRLTHRARKILKLATGPEIQEKAREYGIDALKCLKDIVNSKISSDVARISAAQTLLDRGYGRPTQTNINASVNTDGQASEVSDQELNRRIEDTLKTVEGLTKRKREKIQDEERPPDVRQLH